MGFTYIVSQHMSQHTNDAHQMKMSVGLPTLLHRISLLPSLSHYYRCTRTQPVHGSSQWTEKWHLITLSRELRHNWLQCLHAEATLFTRAT